ncbi:MAG: E3 binding domain-containing protein, partial [Proteobacteria bacterium]|nr:E3 binding domain-containing protein [Pseudomonadota bacterium]
MEIKAPVFPESIADGEVASWHVAEGQWVSRDEILVDIETDKVVLEVVAPAPGRITKIVKTTGETVLSEALLAEFEAGEGEAISVPSDSTEMAADAGDSSMSGSEVNRPMPVASPAARKLAEESGVDLRGIQGSGK